MTISDQHGLLCLVATPIGHLGDISPRAAEVLANADVVACEDTRRTGRLLAHLGIRAPRLVVVNDHTEHDRIPELVELVRDGRRVALVSDAGTPGVSDPGERVVAAVTAAGLDVSVVPGPSAVIAALVISGLATSRFVFEGFLDRRGSSRTRRLEEIAVEERTVVLYEAPHRLVRTLTDLREVCGDERRIVMVRELTKLHEERWSGTLAEAVDHTEAVPPRGEYVLVLDGATPPPESTEADLDEVLATCRAQAMTTRDAAAEAARRLGVSRRRAYQRALVLDATLTEGSRPLRSEP